MISKEQMEKILTNYRPWIYGYKRLARELGLTRDQVRQVVLTATKSMRRKQMTSSAPKSVNLNETNVMIENRDLSQYGTDAEKIEFLQDENRFLRALLIEYQKEFLPEALAHYPLFQSGNATKSDSEARDNNSGKNGASRSLKKKVQTQPRSLKQLVFDAIEHSQVPRKITEYCRIGKVSRAGFYKYTKTAKDNKDEQIAEEVMRIQNEFGHRVGILKTCALLKERDICVGHNKLARIMRDYSLNPTFNRKRYPQDYYRQRKESRKSQERVNILSREFKSERPGQKLVTDMTYVRVIGGWLYLSAIIDLFNGDVVAFRMAKRLDVDLAIQTLNTLSDNGYTHEEACIFHSDQGFTYTHERFITALKTQGFTQSFSRIGNCWDNACVESFFGHLKAELGITHQKTTWSYEVAKKTIEEYVEYYRTKRIQARLGYRTPQQVLLDYQASQA